MSDYEPKQPLTFGSARTAGEYADEASALPVRGSSEGERIFEETLEQVERMSQESGAQNAGFEGPDEVIVDGENFSMERKAGALVVKSAMASPRG